MRYGFWEDRESFLEDYPDTGWNYLEDEFKTHNRTPYNFLHGECDIFARYLSDKYGYMMSALYEEPNQLIHAYCTNEVNGVVYYIDVRGITDNWEEFIREFYDTGIWCGDYSYSYFLEGKELDEVLNHNRIEMSFLEAYKASAAIDGEYRYYDFYDYRFYMAA